jgi:excisionase family DNA binding protein
MAASKTQRYQAKNGAKQNLAKRAPAQPAPSEVVGAFKIRQAATYLGGISVMTMHRLIDRGMLRPNRALRHILFSKAELDRFLAEHTP